MRAKLVMFCLLAGTVVGCASNPPPPPPMAMAPEPAPAPAPAPMAGPVDGVYKGMAELAADAPARCRRMTAAQTVRVRRGMFVLPGVRGRVGADGTVMAAARGQMLTGTVSNGTMDVTTTTRGCVYHYTLTRA